MLTSTLPTLAVLSCLATAGMVAALEAPLPEFEPNSNSEPQVDEASASAAGYRLLPVPIVITEPAVGEGVGIALALFHPEKQGKSDAPPLGTYRTLSDVHRQREAPPVVTAVGGGYTTNDSWAVGVAHSNNWRRDSIRYTGAVGTAYINSRIYIADQPLEFTMDSDGVFQEFMLRLGDSDFMLGGGLLWLDASTRFGFEIPGAPVDPGLNADFTNASLGLNLLYETRNNATRPTSGQLAEVQVWRYDRQLGGDFDYWSWKARLLSFHSLGERLTLGVRLDFNGIDGRVPFFAYPDVGLRGIPALRYQDRTTGALETELRYLLSGRWELSVFGGRGYVSDSVSLFRNPDAIYNYGLGGRFNVFPSRDIWMGLDVARGPEDWNMYIQVGHPW